MTVLKTSGIEWVGDIPSHWEVKPLFAIGHESKQKNRDGFEANLLSLSYGEIVEKDIESNSGLLPESFDTYQKVEPNDLVFRLTDLQNDKRSLRSARSNHSGIITSAYLTFRPTKCDSRYLAYLMRSYDLTKVFYSMGSGLRQSLKYSDFKRMPILLPPIEEQRAIADFLDRELAQIDSLIDQQKKLISLVQERLSGVLYSIARGGAQNVSVAMDGSDPWFQKLPKGWAAKRVSEMGKIINGYPFDSESFSDNSDEMPLVRIRDLLGEVFETFVPPESVPQIALIRDHDVLVGMDGDFNVTFWSRGEAALNQRVCLIRSDEKVISKYISLVLPFALRKINDLTYATTVKHLASSQVAKTIIPMPPSAELEAICNRMAAEQGLAERLIRQAEALISASKERRSALISAAVTGKIDARGRK